MSWPRIGKGIATIITLTLGVWGAVTTYKTAGAEDLRRDLYEPLYRDIVNIERAIEGLNPEQVAFPTALQELKKSGKFARVPKSLQAHLLDIEKKTGDVNTSILAVSRDIASEMSAIILGLRTAEGDRKWTERASEELKKLSTAEKGIVDSAMFTMSHSGRSRGIDMKDPRRPVINAPGGPWMNLSEWLAFPGSLPALEAHWSELDYLYFHVKSDQWYYRITREDLRRIDRTLLEFLTPVHATVRQRAQFKALQASQAPFLSQIRAAKSELSERIRDPKRVRDLVRRLAA